MVGTSNQSVPEMAIEQVFVSGCPVCYETWLLVWLQGWLQGVAAGCLWQLGPDGDCVYVGVGERLVAAKKYPLLSRVL